MQKLAGQIGVFDRFAAAAVEVAVAAGLAGGGPTLLATATRSTSGSGMPAACGGFLVSAGGVVAHQAVDLGHVGKIESCVFPSVAGVTTGATSLVADDAHSEVVGGNGGFAELDLLSMVEGVRRGPFHSQWADLSMSSPAFLVAAQALTGDLGGLRVGGQLDQSLWSGIFLCGSRCSRWVPCSSVYGSPCTAGDRRP
jgi:hypothetical protein